MAVIYRDTYESRHFSFEAYGATSEEARAALLAAVDHHAATVPGVAPHWPEDVRGDLEIYGDPIPFTLGVGYRDGSPITKG